MSWWKKLLEGAKGRLIRATVSLIFPLLVAKYQNNEWYLAATPLLQAISKKLRDSYPGKFEWLPF